MLLTVAVVVRDREVLQPVVGRVVVQVVALPAFADVDALLAPEADPLAVVERLQAPLAPPGARASASRHATIPPTALERAVVGIAA